MGIMIGDESIDHPSTLQLLLLPHVASFTLSDPTV